MVCMCSRGDSLRGTRKGAVFSPQSHADHVIGLQDERSLHIDEGQSVLKAGDVCALPQVRKVYK